MAKLLLETGKIDINGAQIGISKYRRNYYRCRAGCGRMGTIVTLKEKVCIEPGRKRFRPPTPTICLVVCENCGREWIPPVGPSGRALGI
jgi:hypothetical protein